MLSACVLTALAFEQTGQRVEHPGLCPAHVGLANRVEPPALIIEETSLVMEILNGPASNVLSHVQRTVVELTTLDEGNNRARSGGRIDGIGAVIVVCRPPLRKKQIARTVTITTVKRRSKLVTGWARFNDPLQRKQYVRGVKVIDPRLRRRRAVGPRTVVALVVANISRCALCNPAEFCFAGSFTDTCQNSRCQQTRVEDLGIAVWCIAETDLGLRIDRSWQITQNEITHAASDLQISVFYERPRSEGRWHDRRRATWREEVAALPVEVVTPGTAAVTVQLQFQQRR